VGKGSLLESECEVKFQLFQKKYFKAFGNSFAVRSEEIKVCLKTVQKIDLLLSFALDFFSFLWMLPRNLLLWQESSCLSMFWFRIQDSGFRTQNWPNWLNLELTKWFGLLPMLKNNSVSFRLMPKCDLVSIRSNNIIWFHSVQSKSFGLCIALFFHYQADTWDEY
jgi:hypothetical protein